MSPAAPPNPPASGLDRSPAAPAASGLVAVLFTDVVGSTALKQQLGDRGSATLFSEHHGLVRQTLSRFPGGQEIETAGDSFLIIFSAPSAAVQFALQLQTALQRLAQEKGVAIADRVGIHVGEVVIRANERGIKPRELYGIQVDTCARVMALAAGGQILMTRFAFDNARQVLRGHDLEGVGPVHWLNHGPYLFKGLQEPMDVCEVRLGIEGPVTPPTSSEKAQRYVPPEAEPVLGWRPAVDQVVPGTGWLLTEKLGEGGFGEVWLGEHRQLNEKRVFKFCFRADRVRALKREVTLFRLLKERVGEHPNILRLLDVYFDEPPFYIEEEYVAGKDLKRWCDGQGGMGSVPLEAKLEVVAQVADALQAAHDAGVIHRDVKPGNILIAERGARNAEFGSRASSSELRASNLGVKLTDFGIGPVVSAEVLARVTRAGFTQTLLSSGSTQTGTLMYLAPELMAGRPATTQSDIYSLGVVLYQLLIADSRAPVTGDWSKGVSDPLLREDLERCLAGIRRNGFGRRHSWQTTSEPTQRGRERLRNGSAWCGRRRDGGGLPVSRAP
jgi:serine/threonine-protein kinase